MDLKLATASQEILLGPFLDDDDGVTQKTGLTIANTDIKLFKTGGTTLGNKNSGGATEIATGFYYATLDATDTDTLGPLVIVVQMTDCLCVRHEFNVVSAAYYDWVYGSTKPDVNTYSITNDAITAAAIQNGAIDAATFAANAITSTVIADDAITAAKLNTGAITADAFAANAITNAAVADDVDVNVKTMTAGVITAAVIADGAIDAATFAAGAIDAAAIAAGAIDAATLAADMDAELRTIIWNAPTADYGGAGTYGQAVEDILADTNELQVDDYPTSIAAIKTVVDVIQADTDLLDDAAGGLADIHTDVAAVKTVVDAVQAKTDLLTFEAGTNHIEAAVQNIVADAIDATAIKNDAITAAKIAAAAIDQATFAADVYVVANVKKINNTTLTGDGGATPWGPA